jgi:hypothetical protein
MFMKEFGLGLIPAILGMVGVQFIISYLLYKGVIKKYVEHEEILLTGLLLVSIIVEQGVNYRYPIQVGVFLQTTLIEGSSKIGATSISNQLLVGAGLYSPHHSLSFPRDQDRPAARPPGSYGGHRHRIKHFIHMCF